MAPVYGLPDSRQGLVRMVATEVGIDIAGGGIDLFSRFGAYFLPVNMVIPAYQPYDILSGDRSLP